MPLNSMFMVKRLKKMNVDDLTGVSQTEELNIFIPDGVKPTNGTLQIRLFDRLNKRLVGTALHDSNVSVGFVDKADAIRGKPSYDVYLGLPPTDLSMYVSIGMLDGLHYPEGGLVEL